MTEVHATADELEQYVIGALEAVHAQRLEAHVDTCADCAGRLAREARFEVSLLEVAAQPPRRFRRAPRMWVSVAGATLAAAAVWLFVVRVVPPPAAGAPRVVRCGDPASATTCIRAAHFDGLLSVGPGDEVEVPRYDEMPVEPSRRSAP